MIDSFKGENRWLSNFYTCLIRFEGMTYHSTEAAYQAAKTLDLDVRAIFTRLDPKNAKKLGAQLKVRSDWMQVNLGLMKDLNRQKFEDPELKARLLATGDEELVEGNNWGDTFWGKVNGKGENWLGRILMEVRDELRKAQKV